MHLLDIPKPKRSAPRHSTLVALLSGLCGLGCVLLAYKTMPRLVASGYPLAVPAPIASPVKYITVTTVVSLRNNRPDLSSTYQMPLMELHDELCTMGERAISQARRSQTDGSAMPLAEQKKIHIGFQKEFAAKYGLTLAKVKMIQKEGCQQKHGTEMCALSFITDVLELDRKAFSEKYGVILKENGEFIPIEGRTEAGKNL